MEADGPVVEITRVIQGLTAWVFLATFWYDGEPFEYALEVGTPVMVQASAEAVAKRDGHLARVRRAFLNEVHLEMQH